MADVIDAFPSTAGRPGPSGSPPWPDRFLDGRIWRLVKGVDFQATMVSATAYIRKRVNAKGLRAKVAVCRAEKDVVYVQARPKP